ncbi:hypothetical protein BCEP4_1640005 [Burkholderia cepacia]|nr:hypothetical protein BCEP4_1640005 [Burkholderia cepacia]
MIPIERLRSYIFHSYILQNHSQLMHQNTTH